MDETNPELNPEGEAPEAAGAPGAGVVQDLRSMGLKLAAMMRAAAGTPEAEEVKADVRQGVEALRQEIDKALQRVPTPEVQSSVHKGTEVATGATQRLRVEAAGWLREANRALDKLADALQGSAAAPEPPAPPEAPESAESPGS